MFLLSSGDYQNHLSGFSRFVQEQVKEYVPEQMPDISNKRLTNEKDLPNTTTDEICSNDKLPSRVTASSHPISTSADAQNDCFNKVFRVPSKTQATSRRIRRTIRSRPPVVASSEDYKKYYQKLEADKAEKEKQKAAKRAIRSAKKARGCADKMPR